jgi:hypothetical protein
MRPSPLSASSSTLARSPTTAAHESLAPQPILQYEMAIYERMQPPAIRSAGDDVVSMIHVDEEPYTAALPNRVTTLSTLASVVSNEAHEVVGSRSSCDLAQVEGTMA